MKIILFTIGAIIIFVMSFYAFQLWKKLKIQNAAIAQARRMRIERLKESIVIIAQAMQSGECNHSEGVLRLKMLLEPLGIQLDTYPAMSQLHQVVKEMPTHDARRELKKQDRMRLDLLRESTEAELETQINSELNQLLIEIKDL